MNKTKLIFSGSVALILAAVLYGCVKDKGAPPKPSLPSTPDVCDTVTYAKHIKPIVDINCALSGCHAGATSNPMFTSYELFKERADLGRIKARVIDGPSFMPPTGKLPQAQIDLINCWLENGKKP